MNAFKYMNFKGMLLAATILPGPMILAAPVPATAQIDAVISCNVPPPVLPVYAQPPMPEEGYIWTPGYWQWTASTGYYWVPGTWILPPAVGMLWTPPYWGWSGGLYLFHGGYWGPHVGYYGGIDYGYGYGGSGYQGGRWEGGHFAYNQSVNNFGSVRVGNAYRENVTAGSRTRVSYAGGTRGIKAEPTAAERETEHENHQPVTPEQSRHFTAAAGHPGLVAARNHGRPVIAATARPAQFEGPGVVRAQAPRAAVSHQAARPAFHQAARPAEPRAAAPRQQAAHEEKGREK